MRSLACSVSAWVVGIGLVAGATGCSSPVYRFGERVQAEYAGRTLTVRLPETVQVPQVMAAMQQVLRDRGYTVEESSSTAELGTIITKGPRVITYPRVVIEARQTADACVVSLRNEPFGDQDQVEQLMRAALEKLGV